MFSSSRPCPKCGGKGTVINNPCHKCHGVGRVQKPYKVNVNIPAGIDDRQIVTLRGEGNRGINGGPAGDLRIGINVRPHPFFERDGYDVICNVTLSFAQVALGAEIKVPTLDGQVKYTVNAGTQPGDVFRLKGKVSSILTVEAEAISLCILPLKFRNILPRNKRSCFVNLIPMQLQQKLTVRIKRVFSISLKMALKAKIK